jgi:FtsZ-binding cell division protein ZapB
MGTIMSSNKKRNGHSDIYDEHLLNDEYNNSVYNNSNIGTLIEPLKFEINKLKDENNKLKVEIRSLRDKNENLDADIFKIQNNYGKEIYGLNQYYSSLQKDVVTLLNNQKIISEIIQNNSMIATNSPNIHHLQNPILSLQQPQSNINSMYNSLANM